MSKANIVISGAKKQKIAHPRTSDLSQEIPDDDGLDLKVKDIIINNCAASSSAVPNSLLQDKLSALTNRVQFLLDQEKKLMQRRAEAEKALAEAEKELIDIECSLNVIQMHIKKLGSRLGDILMYY